MKADKAFKFVCVKSKLQNFNINIYASRTGGNHCEYNGMLLSTTCNADQITDILISVLQNRMDKESETVLATCGVFYSFLFHMNSSFTDKFIQGLDMCFESLTKLILSHGTSSISNKSVKLLSRIGITLLRCVCMFYFFKWVG